MCRCLVVALVVLSSAPVMAQAPSDFPDVLRYVGRPQKADDWPASGFSDQGAWFAYTLPPSDDASLRGAFIGPFLIDRGIWAATALARPIVIDRESGRPLSFADATLAETVGFPGRLHQHYVVDGVEVALDLIVGTPRRSLIRAIVTNVDNRVRQLALDWTGEIDGGSFSAPERPNRDLYPGLVFFRSSPTRAGYAIVNLRCLDAGLLPTRLRADGRSFVMASARATSVSPGLSLTSYFAEEVYPGRHDAGPGRTPAEVPDSAWPGTAGFDNPARVFIDNEVRWSGYLAATLRMAPEFAGDAGYRTAAVKALMTLVGNWRAPLGGLYHAGLFPSAGVKYFNGFWAWDSWKQAVALARIAPDLAKDQVRAMFDYQDVDGMVADCVYADSKENNWLNTKPPLAGWAAWRVFDATRDIGFLGEMYPKLLKYHRWWYEKRDRDRNGLCEYGATAGRVDAARWESGMDNAVRFDGSKLVKTGDRSWSLDQESVDLNAYLLAEKDCLNRIAAVIGQPRPFPEEATRRLRDAIRERMFDRASGYFYDARSRDAGAEPIGAQGPEGWIPLWAGVASEEQAAAVRQVMVDPKKFATFVPFPTLAADNPRLERQGYWRGPVWLDQAYFGIEALRRYGYQDDARRLTRQLIDHLEGLTKPGVPIRENYDPLDGKGLEAPGFSWSAAHVLLLLWGI